MYDEPEVLFIPSDRWEAAHPYCKTVTLFIEPTTSFEAHHTRLKRLSMGYLTGCLRREWYTIGIGYCEVCNIIFVHNRDKWQEAVEFVKQEIRYGTYEM